MNNKKRSKIIKLLIVTIFLGIIVTICIKRWNAWFNNPVEPDYISNNIPDRIQLTFGNDGQFSRNVSWQCGNTTEISKLFVTKTTGTDTVSVPAEGKAINTKGGTTVSYHAKLADLSVGRYSYSVCTGEKHSGWYNFDIEDNDTFRFIYIGDIQDTIGGNLKNFFTYINQSEKDAAFWLLGGDVIERPQDRYWNEYYKSMDSISQTKPFIACPGNHEYLKGISGKLEERFIYNFSYFLDSQSNGNAVFDICYGNTAIITLDSNRDTWTLFSQRSWLKKALEKNKDAKWKIVVLHHPFYSVRGKSRHYFIRRLFEPLIQEYGVDIVLQGHEHCYARMIIKDKNNNTTTPIYLISHSSPKDYRIKLTEKYDRFGNGVNFYQTIDISSDTLSLKSFTGYGELYDNICVTKTDNKLQVIDLSTGIPEQFNPELSHFHK